MSEVAALLASKDIYTVDVLSSTKIRVGICDDVVVGVWIEQNGEFVHIENPRDAISTLAMDAQFSMSTSSFDTKDGGWRGLKLEIV